MAVNANLPIAVIIHYFVSCAEREGVHLDGQKLQKLLYLAYGWHLGYFAKALTKEKPVFTMYGPFFLDIGAYSHLAPLRRLTLRMRAFLHPLRDETETLLSKVWSSYRDFTGPQLSSYCRKMILPSEYVDEFLRFKNVLKRLVIDDAVLAASFAAEIKRLENGTAIPMTNLDNRVVDIALFKARAKSRAKRSPE